ncbi:hypothetical protein FVEN_g8987 [Fusarium venenatum]|uniref:Pt repeat family protein n=1 Tax=Fusarium venenatum TaxID=56646 RepID=A0A2L2TSM7_9HYPO|nr:uncharacterized protein FVRRES_00652 [Fusarium venenatum]KAG8353011.1 hypothetical protein FVEN_g8987 [Fusarium venenatum]KAH7006116.1 hypothetical protein EDB82DRAFT_107743 [Fusarium venenatum]CEI64140.1 unnamed protein product [Fusarium venenatum]
MHLRRSSNSADGHSSTPSPSFSLSSAKRRFPLLSRRKTRHSDVSESSAPPLASPSASPSPNQNDTKSNLRVHVDIKFESPHSSEYVRDYEASSRLKATDRICQALLSRLQHCSSELITRHDSNALDPLRKPHRDVKPLRYRITYRVERDGINLVEKSLRSFQEYELTHDDTREVVAATDRIIGLFLVRHDPGFRWSEPVESEPASPESEIFRPCTGRPQSMACIPRSHFVHNSQKFEFVSGYSIELFLRSRCATRYPESRNASIKIDSHQPSPLPLLLGEELTTRVSNLIIDPVDAWKRKFDKRHKSCAGLEGSGGCSHIEDGAVDIMVKVRNHIGPDYTYFSHRIQTSKVLFNDHNGRDFDEFANQVKAKLEKARDLTDKSMRSLDDLVLTVHELRGKAWAVHEPLVVRLDPTITYCRQTMEAVMERLQTGISNVLEHHEDALATMTVHKRGHLIFDGFLDGAGGDDTAHFEKFATPDLERKALEAHLKERIRSDITMLCRDTCAIDCPEALPNLRFKASGSTASPFGAASSTRPALSTASSSVAPTTPSLTASPLLRQASESSFNGSFASSHSDNARARKVALQNLRDSVEPPSTPVTPSPDLRRVPSGVEMAKRHGYMSDFMADDENQSEPPSTPSLVDTDSISPRDSVVATPSRSATNDQSNEGLRIVDDGRRIIYQEQSDMDAIASGMVQFHRPITDDDEPIQLTKDKSTENSDKESVRHSLNTCMPDLSGNVDHLPLPEENEAVASQEETQPVAPVTTELQRADVAVEETPSEKNVTDAPTTQDEQCEMDEARDVPRQYSTEVEANSKSETSFGSTPEASIHEEIETQETQLSNDSEVPTPKADVVATGEQDITDVDAAQKTLDVSVLTYFPRPPSIHSQADEVNHSDQKEGEEPAEFPFELPAPDAKETEELSRIDNPQVLEGAPASSNSEVSVQGDTKDQEAQPVIGTEQVENSFLPLSAPTKAQVPAETDDLDIGNQKAQAADTVPEPHPEMITHFLETVPEDTPLEPSPTVTGDVQVVSTESVKTQAGAPKFDERPYLPTVASAPPERVALQDDFAIDTEEDEEKGQETPRNFDVSDFSDALSRPRTRPRTNTLPGRRYSTALTLEIDLKAHCDPDEEDSPTDSPPKSASGDWRPYTLHRRQPSAGFIGLPEQRRLHSVGLRSAVLPYRWQQMRREQALLEGRPGTSHSEA